MEHSELVEEMSTIEQMSTQERLQLAKRRRRSQLKAWASREMDWLKRRPSGQRNNSLNRPGIRFSDNVILLEAASRNDILEGLYDLLVIKLYLYFFVVALFRIKHKPLPALFSSASSSCISSLPVYECLVLSPGHRMQGLPTLPSPPSRMSSEKLPLVFRFPCFPTLYNHYLILGDTLHFNLGLAGLPGNEDLRLASLGAIPSLLVQTCIPHLLKRF